MKSRSLRSKIFLAMTAVVVGFVLLGTFTMDQLLDRLLDREIGQGLVRARDAHARFARIRDELLADKVRSIAQVPHLRATLGTPDVDDATVAFTVETVAEVAGAPLVLLVGADGELLAEAGEPDAARVSLLDRPGVASMLGGRSWAGVWEHGSRVYRVTAGPVMLGDRVLGLLCLGQPLDGAEAEDLAHVTGHGVFLFQGDRLLGRSAPPDHDGPRAGAEPGGVPAELARGLESDGSRRVFLDGAEHLVTAVPLSGGVTLVLARPIDELLAQFRLASRSLLVVGIVLAGVGLVLTARISDRISLPIQEVVRASKALAAGDLSSSATVAEGDELGVLGRSFNDMARRIETLVEEVLEKAHAAEQASRAKSKFLATMSHEIRTPMNGLLGFSELLRDADLDERAREYASNVNRTGRELLGVLDAILDLSQVESGRMELEEAAFDVRTAIGQAVEPWRAATEEKGLALEVDVDAAVPERLLGDPGRFRQVVESLVSNAVKFTSSGSVRVEAGLARSDGDERVVRVAVSDTGIGVAEEQIGRLFEPFYQVDAEANRRFGGSGLGLAICAEIASLMGGECGVERRAGGGSIFWFTGRLRTAGPDAPERAAGHDARGGEAVPPTPSGSRRAGARVLYVEDNPVNQRMVAIFLEKAGCEAEIAANGAEALERLHSGDFDLVLMDCQMPVMDGYEATRRIREREAGTGLRVPIVALTANAMAGDRERCLDAGMDDFLAKPASFTALAGALERWLASPSHGAA